MNTRNMVATTIHRNPVNGETVLVYHRTPVVTVAYIPGQIHRRLVTLRTGGYETPTTKRRMNQAAQQMGLSYSVHQQGGRWFVRIDNDPPVEFTGGEISFTCSLR